MSFDNAKNAYQEVGAQTADQIQLVVMLYDGAIRFLGEAKSHIEHRNLPAKAVAVDKALAIIGELQSTLKFEEGGEVAVSLDKLYAYMTGRILEASLRLDVKAIDEVVKLLGIVNNGWMGIAAAQVREPQVPLTTNTPEARPLEIFG